MRGGRCRKAPLAAPPGGSEFGARRGLTKGHLRQYDRVALNRPRAPAVPAVPLLKLRSNGRGRSFTPLRGLVESVQRIAYAYDWPARLLSCIPAASRVRVVHHRLPLRAGRRPLRIAFASDLHIGPLTPAPLLDEAFARITEARPDVLALGGDYVSLEVTASIAARLASLVAGVDVPVKVAVLGNHDLWTRHELIEDALAAGGARVLLNEAVHLPPPFDDVALVGLDDPWTGDIDPDQAFAATDRPVKLALAHAPESVPFVEGRGAQLLLCGHTHGGQVATPWGPMAVQGRLSRRWPHGLYQLDDMHLFVSRGVGYSDLPVRSFAPSDIAIIDVV
jgi:predicted MPP superfamily phosphohydrolase